MNTHLPVAHLNTELQKLGRKIDDAIVLCHFWQGDDYRLQLIWGDGLVASVGLGPEASKLIAECIERQKAS